MTQEYRRSEGGFRIGYIVSAYQRPAQLIRLVGRLRAPWVTTCLHIDARSLQAVHDEVGQALAGFGDVQMLEPHPCRWGDFGHVRATLKGLDRLASLGLPDYVVLLTGQDYPLKPATAIRDRLAAAGGQSFMHARPLPIEALPDGGYDRLPDREVPGGLAPHFGSGYWCLHRDAVTWLLDYLGRHPDYVPYFERAHIPDEMFFQTLLAASPLASSIVQDDLRYIRWPGPAVLTSSDLPALTATSDLFARKFDMEIDAAVLDAIDRDLRV